MEDRASNLESDTVFVVNPPSRIDQSLSSELVARSPLVSVPFATARELESNNQKRRKRFFTFIKLELSALVLLAVIFVAGTSKQFAQPEFTLPFEIALVLAAVVVALIPVIFYGPTRQKYRYRSQRTRPR
jgi:uncharacterized integral membrane protein